MSALGYKLKPEEAEALRECATATLTPFAYVPLSTFLPDVMPRVFIGRLHDIDPPFKFIAKIGTDPRSPEAKIARERLKLLPQVYFRVGPRCRSCGERLRDGDHALSFRFSPDRRDDRTRVAYLHMTPCGGGYVIEAANGEPYAFADSIAEAESWLHEGRAYLQDALDSAHPRAATWVAERTLHIRLLAPGERERIREERGTPVLEREP